MYFHVVEYSMTTDKLNLVKNSVSESLGQLYQARHHVGCLKDEDEGIIFDDIVNLQSDGNDNTVFT